MGKIVHYGDVCVYETTFDDAASLGNVAVDSVYLRDASNKEALTRLQKAGFLFVDRTLLATISLAKQTQDTRKLIRLPMIETHAYRSEILAIAIAAFTEDRRFHVMEQCNASVAEKVLKHWVDELDQVLVCLLKEQPVGFLALKELAPDTLFIHLAAVEEKSRLSGAAMSLYARAVEIAKMRGYKKLQGRISSTNTAVMNIYSAFGATFSAPEDIMIKEVGHASR
jgi:L-amino acid N-acyltransferase YncA